MATRQMKFHLSMELASRLGAAVQFAAAHSIYPHCVSTEELTTAQAMVLSLFYSLLKEDTATVLNLLSVAPFLPQLKSSFITVWLRDDYKFHQKDVAKVLSVLSKLISERVAEVHVPIVVAFTGLEEKYDIFNFFRKTGDTTAQEMLAYMNPLVTRATQTGLEGVKDQAVEAKPVMHSAFTQTDAETQRISRKQSEYTEPTPSISMTQQPRTTQQASPVAESVTSSALPETGNIPGSSAQSVIEEYLDAERMEEIINVPDMEGNLPIHRAAMDGRTDVIEALLILGAEINNVNCLGMTPLQMAISSSQTGTITLLLSHGASLESRDIMGMTPLHHAAYHGIPDVMRLLLSYPVNKEAKDTVGNRPLHIALKLGHLEVVRLLVDAGVNKKVRDSDGFRPLEWALRHGSNEMVRLLKGQNNRYN